MTNDDLSELRDLLYEHGRTWKNIQEYTCPATQSAYGKAFSAIVAFCEKPRQPAHETVMQDRHWLISEVERLQKQHDDDQRLLGWQEQHDPRRRVQITAHEPETGHWYCGEDIDRLVQELDVWINGQEGAAKQAKLCDIVAQITRRRECPHTVDGKHETHDGGPDCRYCDGTAQPPLASQPCAIHAAEHRLRNELPCPWCVIDELKRNRDSATPPPSGEDLLRLAITTIEQLAEQQVLGDQWYLPKLNTLRNALTKEVGQ